MPHLDEKTGHVKFHKSEQFMLARAKMLGNIVERNSNQGSKLRGLAIGLQTTIAQLMAALDDQPNSNAPLELVSHDEAVKQGLVDPGDKTGVEQAQEQARQQPPAELPPGQPAPSNKQGHGSGKGRTGAAAFMLALIAGAACSGQDFQGRHSGRHAEPAIIANLHSPPRQNANPGRSGDYTGYEQPAAPVFHAYIPRQDSPSCQVSRLRSIQDYFGAKQINANYRNAKRQPLEFAEYARLASAAAPEPVPLQPHLGWPSALAGTEFMAERFEIEQAAYRNDPDTAREIIEQLESKLRDKIAGLNPARYVEAKKFLLGLKRST